MAGLIDLIYNDGIAYIYTSSGVHPWFVYGSSMVRPWFVHGSKMYITYILRIYDAYTMHIRRTYINALYMRLCCAVFAMYDYLIYS